MPPLGLFQASAVACAACVALFTTPAVARTIYTQDFQKGAAPEWVASGVGDVRLSLFQANVSLKFTGHSRSTTEVSTRGLRDVVVRFKLAAAILAPGDVCAAEVSPDGGSTWLTAVTARKGQDGGVAFVVGAFADPRLDDRAKLSLRFRAELSARDAACWGDDVLVEGDAPAAPGALAPTTDGMPPPGAHAPDHVVHGRLTVTPPLHADGAAVLTDLAHIAASDAWKAWPALTMDLISDRGRLIPSPSGLQISSSGLWDWVVGAGVIWLDPAVRGGLRAVLPVALEEHNANCVHNGRLVLAFQPGGGVARARIQIDNETCAYFRFDGWSEAAATFTPDAIVGATADAAVARERDEVAARPPAKPLVALGVDYPGVDLAALSRAAGPFAVFGLYDGVTHYAAPCPTRAGEDLLCAERSLPSYSTAKSLVAAQALMRLEALSPGASLERVADHVPACAAAAGWADVRLIDLLDMTSGHYRSDVHELDEDSATLFFSSTTAAEKLNFACGYPRRSAPRKTFVYHSFDTFLLGGAMTDVLRRSGHGTDLYDDLIRPIWRNIGQSAALDTTRRTAGADPLPFTAYGLTYHRDDVIRAARFITGDTKLAGSPYLDRRLLDEALQRSEPGGGKEAIFPDLRYRHGFWARDVGRLIGCRHPVWTPYMSGYGGISVVLFPNSVIYYAFGDVEQFDWAAAVPEIDKIRPLCVAAVAPTGR